jgi:hypothetical protein
MSSNSKPFNSGHTPTLMRLAYSYVRLLFILELLLFIASLSLHVSAMVGARVPSEQYILVLFRGTVLVGVQATAFMKDSVRWVDQIKRCPPWMWKVALTVMVYGLFIACLKVIFPGRDSLSDQIETVSVILLGFDAIYLCILYPVLWLDYLDKTEVIKRAIYALIFVSLTGVAFLAHWRVAHP